MPGFAELSYNYAGRPCCWIDDAVTQILPLRTMAKRKEEFRAQFASAKPYPHLVIDGLFDEEVLDRVVQDFPKNGQRDWICYDTRNEIKQTSRGIGDLSALTQLLFLQLSSEPFLEQLRYVTGISDLIWDPMFHGAGLHESFQGGWLNVHADWTHHPTLPLTRRLNLIVYLNRDWQEAWGGNLDLIDPDTLQAGASIAPVFNRSVLFPTSARTPHGFPDPLKCPANHSRKSISVYYWTPNSDAIREGSYINFLPGNGRTRSRAMIRSLIPPILFETSRLARSRFASMRSALSNLSANPND